MCPRYPMHISCTGRPLYARVRIHYDPKSPEVYDKDLCANCTRDVSTDAEKHGYDVIVDIKPQLPRPPAGMLKSRRKAIRR